METWHPVGVVGVISAFNFPAAVWSWNSAIGIVCGNAIVWKSSEKTPLSALASQAVFERAAEKFGGAAGRPFQSLHRRCASRRIAGRRQRVPLVSATGSTAMGKNVGPRLAKRFARMILELGGNNAGIVCPSADLDLACARSPSRHGHRRPALHHTAPPLRARQRLRHARAAPEKAYPSVPIGDPPAMTLIGPLIDKRSFDGQQKALDEAKALGGAITGGERVMAANMPTATT